ncbi:MAG TPA: 3-oxo-tetronate kinase [Bryobacteraceae bacterium]|nr:3-oxo-tetronate kinase [Bryobacteraceae bacterium]
MPQNGLRLGAIADDFTGGSDMAGMLASRGVRTVQTFGVPSAETRQLAANAEAIVVSLKSRSITAADAVHVSLQALDWLRELDPKQVQFKYCSTFDSTHEGNIGPVTSALMSALGVPFTIAVPALPVNGRTQYMGHLFVNGIPLSESPMRHHPLNPMTDSNLVRHLQLQTDRRVGLIDWHSLQRPERSAPDAEIAFVDALDSADLDRIAARYASALPLLTGGSGITQALPAMWRQDYGWLPRQQDERRLQPGRALLLAGSCSVATLGQIDAWKNAGGVAEAMRLDRLGPEEVERLSDFCNSSARPVLIYSSAPSSQRYGSPHAIEQAFGELARRLRTGYDVMVVAGGETSGAVVEALNVRAVEIGPEIDPGVPALYALGSEPRLRLALKSGNFGGVDFFANACRALNASP